MSLCEKCGSSSYLNELRGVEGHMRCVDVCECRRKEREQLEEAEWYAEEVKRMADRAPA